MQGRLSMSEANPAATWLFGMLQMSLQYLQVRTCGYVRAQSMMIPLLIPFSMQASTESRPKQQPKKQGGADFGSFMKGDLPGKLATILVGCYPHQHGLPSKRTRRIIVGEHKCSPDVQWECMPLRQYSRASCGDARCCAAARAVHPAVQHH